MPHGLIQHPQLKEVMFDFLGVQGSLELREVSTICDAAIIDFLDASVEDALRRMPQSIHEVIAATNQEKTGSASTSQYPSVPADYVFILHKVLDADRWSNLIHNAQVLDDTQFEDAYLGEDGRKCRAMVKLILGDPTTPPANLEYFRLSRLRTIGRLGPYFARCTSLKYLVTSNMLWISESEEDDADPDVHLRDFSYISDATKEANVLVPWKGFSTLFESCPQLQYFDTGGSAIDYSDFYKAVSSGADNLVGLRIGEQPAWSSRDTAVASFPRLQFLTIANVNTRGLDLSIALADCENLVYLDIRRSGSTDEELIAIAQKNPKLQHLGINWAGKLDRDFFAQLPSLCPSLTSLDIGIDDLDIGSWRSFVASQGHKLVHLGIAHPRGTNYPTTPNPFVQSLLDQPRLSLQSLQFFSVNPGVTQQQALLLFQRCPSLRVFRANQFPLTDTVVQEGLALCSNLEVLECSESISESSMETICKRCRQIVELKLGRITDLGFEHVLTLQKLRDLYANGFDLTIKGIEVLAQEGPRSNIRRCCLVDVQGDPRSIYSRRRLDDLRKKYPKLGISNGCS